jgi:hypothetical protein
MPRIRNSTRPWTDLSCIHVQCCALVAQPEYEVYIAIEKVTSRSWLGGRPDDLYCHSQYSAAPSPKQAMLRCNVQMLHAAQHAPRMGDGRSRMASSPLSCPSIPIFHPSSSLSRLALVLAMHGTGTGWQGKGIHAWAGTQRRVNSPSQPSSALRVSQREIRSSC